MIRYHVEFAEQVSTFGGFVVKSGVTIDNGNFKAIIDYDGDDADFFEACLEEDANVITYSC
jgi:hypothetical protein